MRRFYQRYGGVSLRAWCTEPRQVDEFMTLAPTIDWLPQHERRNAPSAYISDLVAYLQTTLASLVTLPARIRDDVHVGVCKHISSALLGLLTSPSVKKFNMCEPSSFSVVCNAIR